MIDKNQVAFENRIRLHETKCPSPDSNGNPLATVFGGKDCIG
jgi:hypothetical protein